MLNIPLADITFKELRDHIYDKSGIYISDSKKYLVESRLSKVLKEKNINSFEDYLKLVKFSANGNELSILFDAVTTNETYFFREPEQLTTFVNDITPRLLSQKKGSQTIRIWSAACSTGEEPYTLAMMLLEKGYSPKQFEILASDLGDAVLQSARGAVYNSYSVRNVSESYLKKYFSGTEQMFSLTATVKNMVKFNKINLIEDKNVKSLRNTDVIFCRNVLIYFDTRSKQKVVSNLYDCLNSGGYLFIGASESLHNVTRAFRPNILNKVIAYQKE